MKHLPLLPAPFLDETFGSWFARAAANYHTDVRGLASAILSSHGEKPPRHLDLDTKPPEQLLVALTRYSRLHRSELERLIVPPSGSTLPARHRDVYCAACLAEDRLLGVVYARRAWLDAWTLVCDKNTDACLAVLKTSIIATEPHTASRASSPARVSRCAEIRRSCR